MAAYKQMLEAQARGEELGLSEITGQLEQLLPKGSSTGSDSVVVVPPAPAAVAKAPAKAAPEEVWPPKGALSAQEMAKRVAERAEKLCGGFTIPAGTKLPEGHSVFNGNFAVPDDRVMGLRVVGVGPPDTSVSRGRFGKVLSHTATRVDPAFEDGQPGSYIIKSKAVPVDENGYSLIDGKLVFAKEELEEAVAFRAASQSRNNNKKSKGGYKAARAASLKSAPVAGKKAPPPDKEIVSVNDSSASSEKHTGESDSDYSGNKRSKAEAKVKKHAARKKKRKQDRDPDDLDELQSQKKRRIASLLDWKNTVAVGETQLVRDEATLAAGRFAAKTMGHMVRAGMISATFFDEFRSTLLTE